MDARLTRIALIVCTATLVSATVDAASTAFTPGLRPRPVKAEMAGAYRESAKDVGRRLRQAQLMMKTGQYGDCIDICDEILILDKDNKKARALRGEASDTLTAIRRANVDNDNRVRDMAAMTELMENLAIPERGADLRRPDRIHQGLPFQPNDGDVAALDEKLDQRIEEINFNEVDVSYLLQTFFKAYDINLILSPGALDGKTITIQARDIRLRDVLDHLSRAEGIHYTVKNGIVWVYAEDQTDAGTLFRPEVIPIRRGLVTADGESEISDIESWMEWMEENWPGWPEATRWRMDYKSHSLLVISTPEMIASIKEMLQLVDVPPVQVLITTLFVEIGESDLNDIGFSYDVEANPQEPGNNNSDKITIGNSAINTGVVTDGGLNLALQGVLNEHEFSATINALVRKGSSRLLTAPRIIALSNRQAEIKLTRNQPFVSEYEIQSGGNVTNDNAATTTTIGPKSWGEIELGFTLKVLPSVGRDMKTITLQAVPTITNFLGYETANIVTTDSDGRSNSVEVKRPKISVDTLEAESVLEDGSTIVVGGLVRDNMQDIERSIPGLRRIPVLRHLFKSTQKTRDRTCLLIFMTARIISPSNRVYSDNPGAERAGPYVVAEETPDLTPEEINRMLGIPTASE